MRAVVTGMRKSNLARPLRSPFRPGGIAHPLDREDITLSLVDLEPWDDDDDEGDDTEIDLLCTIELPRTKSDIIPRVLDDVHISLDLSLDELSVIEDDEDAVVASCGRLSQLCPTAEEVEELEPEPEPAVATAMADEVWVDVSDLDAGWDVVEVPGPVVSCASANPFFVEEPATFAPEARASGDSMVQPAEAAAEEDEFDEWLEALDQAKRALDALPALPELPAIPELTESSSPSEPEAVADDMLDPPTVDIDWLIDEDRSETFAIGTHPATRREPEPQAETRPVLRRSWICMPADNTNAPRQDLSRLDIARLEEIVRRRARESRDLEAHAPMMSLPRFPILPSDPRPKVVHPPKVVRIPSLRLPRFNVD